MFSKNFNVFVELFLYMLLLGSFVMIDVLVVCSLHSKFLQVWVFWCCWPQLWQHCCPLQCLAMWLNYWQLQHLIIGFLYICFTLLRFFKKVYSFLDVLFCWFGCLSQVVRMIGSGCRFKSTSTPNHLHNL